MNIFDLKTPTNKIKKNILKRIEKVLSHQKFINGPEVNDLEKKLITFTKSKYLTTTGNGTDSLSLISMSLNLDKRDFVLMPTFSYQATANSFLINKQNIFLVDVDIESYNICIKSIKKAIFLLKKNNLNPKAIVAVDLFGRPCDYNELISIAKNEKITLISDSAQSFGSLYKNKFSSNYTDYTAVSFFPTKPLGCYGDGGMIISKNQNPMNKIKMLKQQGSKKKYHSEYIGLNSRLDTIQASILLEKFNYFQKEILLKTNLAKTYNENLKYVQKPLTDCDDYRSAWALYSILVKDRTKLVNKLNKQKIYTGVYYPKPFHKQTFLKNYKFKKFLPLKNSEYLSKKILSIPFHAYLSSNQLDKIFTLINKYTKED